MPIIIDRRRGHCRFCSNPQPTDPPSTTRLTEPTLATPGRPRTPRLQNVANPLLRHDAVVVAAVALALVHAQVLSPETLAEQEA